MAEPSRPRCVLDCVVLLQAAVSRGPAFALLTLAEAGRIELLLSNDLLSELRDVLLRKEVHQRFPILSPEFVEAFLTRIQHLGTLTDPVPSSLKLRRDPDDEPYLNLAAHGRAKYLVTRDRDLLDLVEASDDDASQFRRACPDLRILDPVDLLRELVVKPA